MQKTRAHWKLFDVTVRHAGTTKTFYGIDAVSQKQAEFLAKKKLRKYLLLPEIAYVTVVSSTEKPRT